MQTASTDSLTEVVLCCVLWSNREKNHLCLTRCVWPKRREGADVAMARSHKAPRLHWGSE